MAEKKPLEQAVGKLISRIQREWIAESGEADSEQSEEVMDAAHRLLQAAKTDSLVALLGNRTVSVYLGSSWVSAHPKVWPYIQVVEAAALGQLNERDGDSERNT